MSEPDSKQLDFFTDLDRPQPIVSVRAPRASIQVKFTAFHDANPWVYHRLTSLARQLVSTGHSRIGIGMLFEVLRWQYFRTVDPASDFKLNNNYRSRYARLIAAQEPDLAEVFETRELKAA